MRISDWSSDVCSSVLVSPMAHLKDSERRCIRPEQYLTAVRDQELRGPIDDIVVMPYLPGPEISFDILAVNGEMLKYAARPKLGTGWQHIVSRHTLEDLVASIVAKFSLHGVVHAPFRREIVRASCWVRVLQYVSRTCVGSSLQQNTLYS